MDVVISKSIYRGLDFYIDTRLTSYLPWIFNNRFYGVQCIFYENSPYKNQKIISLRIYSLLVSKYFHMFFCHNSLHKISCNHNFGHKFHSTSKFFFLRNISLIVFTNLMDYWVYVTHASCQIALQRPKHVTYVCFPFLC